jgi:putative salt-induced outer membrane protein YdiY
MKIVVLAFAGVLLLSTPASAGEVVLTNGDTLRGAVVVDGTSLLIDHPVLGRLRIPLAGVASHETGPEATSPVAAAAVATLASAPAGTTVQCPCEPEASEDAKKCPKPWDLSVFLGFGQERGNTEKVTFNPDIEGSYKWGPSRLYGRFRGNYEESFAARTEENYHGELKYERSLTSRSRLWGNWMVDSDLFEDLIYRSGWFAGYGYDFVKTKRTTFEGAIGAGYVVEERRRVGRLYTPSLFASLHYKHEFRHGDSFEARYWIAPYLQDTERTPMRLELRYAHPLREHLDLVASYILDYVPDPPDVEPYDSKFILGIRWKP